MKIQQDDDESSDDDSQFYDCKWKGHLKSNAQIIRVIPDCKSVKNQILSLKRLDMTH